MRHSRDDVVARAVEVLDTWGLGDLTMRRLAGELGVQPSALYHHVPDKQTLLALVADRILVRAVRRPDPDGPWDERVVARCLALRDALLAVRDGAEVVATAYAFGLGARAAHDQLVEVLRSPAPAGAALPDDLAVTGARTLVHYVHGHVVDEQTHRQAGSVGAIRDEPRTAPDADFAAGLSIVVDGLRARVSGRAAVS
ncbi:MAG: TetR family transcriptional regulator [Nocardioides sp.]|nr:TetR family transcriptional regulator [Nocardioides sp.]